MAARQGKRETTPDESMPDRANDPAQKGKAAEQNRGDGTDSGGNGVADERRPAGTRATPPSRKTSQSGYGHHSSDGGSTTPTGSGKNAPGKSPR
jgi:hypothetical protein